MLRNNILNTTAFALVRRIGGFFVPLVLAAYFGSTTETDVFFLVYGFVLCLMLMMQVPVILTCGGMMEIVAGRLRRPPRWITDNGFEWAFRLVNQPRHPWKRYLIGNVAFVSRLALHACRIRVPA